MRAWRILALVVFLGSVALILAEDDHYKVLEVSRNADEGEIKKSYRRLSMQFHPDKNKDPSAKDKFTKVATAYEILSDPEKRRIFDMQGSEGLKRHEQRGGRQEHNPFDMFSQMFGGGQRGGDAERRGPDVTIDLEVSLRDIYLGKQMDVMVRKQVLCRQCGGSGAHTPQDVKRCDHCGGSGTRVVRQQIAPGFVQQMQTPCDNCKGKGKIVTRKCRACKGERVQSGRDTVTLDVERGVSDGHTIKIERGGDESPDYTSGNLNFKITTHPHPVFRRNQRNLHTTMKLSLEEALLGFSRDVEQLDGRKVKITRHTVTQHGDVQRVIGEGMPEHNFPSNKGDLLVDYQIQMPNKLTPKQVEGFRQLFSEGA